MAAAKQDAPALNLYQRLIAAAKAIKRGAVSQDVEVTFGERYKAVGHGQVVERTRDPLLDHGVIYFVNATADTEWTTGTTSKGNPTNVCYGVFEILFVNADNPAESHTVRVVGHGIDNQDKAFAKASSYAKKLALMQTLQLWGDKDGADEERDTADDVELPPRGRKQQAPPPASKPGTYPATADGAKAAARDSGVPWDEFKLWWLLHYGTKASAGRDPNEAEYRMCISWAKKGVPIDRASEATDTAKRLIGLAPEDECSVQLFADMWAERKAEKGGAE